MEMIEGEPLAGPLPLYPAVDYARQIAEASKSCYDEWAVSRQEPFDVQENDSWCEIPSHLENANRPESRAES